MPASEAPSSEGTAAVSRAIRNASFAAGALGVVLSPIPLADEIALLPVYGLMTARIARARGIELGAVPWKSIGLTAVAGLAARAAVNVTVSFIPVVAAAANAASGVVLTRFLGKYIDSACDQASKGEVTAPLKPTDFADAFRPKTAT